MRVCSTTVPTLFVFSVVLSDRCVTHGDFAGGTVCPWLVLVSPFSVVLLRSRFSPDFQTPLLVFRSVLELYQLSWLVEVLSQSFAPKGVCLAVQEDLFFYFFAWLCKIAGLC